MALSKAFKKVMGSGKETTRVLYNLIKEVDDKVSAMDGSGETELSMLEAADHEADIIIANSSKVADWKAMSGDVAISSAGATTIQPDAVTSSKLGFKTVAVTVSASGTSGSSAADATLVDGVIIGIMPSGNQDQFVDDVAVGVDGSVTVTLAAAAIADNTFDVTVLVA